LAQQTKNYKNLKQFQKDSAKMQSEGWKITNQTSHKDSFKAGKSCCLGFIFLPLMVFGRGKSSIIVTYDKDDA